MVSLSSLSWLSSSAPFVSSSRSDGYGILGIKRNDCCVYKQRQDKRNVIFACIAPSRNLESDEVSGTKFNVIFLLHYLHFCWSILCLKSRCCSLLNFNFGGLAASLDWLEYFCKFNSFIVFHSHWLLLCFSFLFNI